jgi:hypothetical protein
VKKYSLFILCFFVACSFVEAQTSLCGQGEYYCHEELKCKPANEHCVKAACPTFTPSSVSISTTCVTTVVNVNTVKTVCPAICADQTVHVPLGAKKATIKLWGAGGGDFS